MEVSSKSLLSPEELLRKDLLGYPTEATIEPINGFTTVFDKVNYNPKESLLRKKSKVVKGEKNPSLEQLKSKKAWDIALANAKSIPMNGIMLYMSGNSVSIFSIMITAMLFFQPVKSLLNVDKVFEKLEKDGDLKVDLTLQKMVFMLLNILIMVMGLWKCSSMGLLPTSSSDWLAFEKFPKFNEFTLH